MQTPFLVGAKVKTHGLTTAEYNNLLGKVTGPPIKKNEVTRVLVRVLTSSGSEKSLSLQPKNLMLVCEMPNETLWRRCLDFIDRGMGDKLKHTLQSGENSLVNRTGPWYPFFAASLLHVAAGTGKMDMLRLLLELGADVMAVGETYWTPLHCAADGGHAEVARVLVREYAADVTAITKSKWTPLHNAVAKDHVDVVRVLVLDGGADVTAMSTSGSTPIHTACIQGFIGVARVLLEECGADVMSLDDTGWTPLHWAVFYRHSQLVRLLLKHGADVLAPEENGKTPLTFCKVKSIRVILKSQLKWVRRRGFLMFLATQSFLPPRPPQPHKSRSD
jgi:hypothetical protein